MGRTWPYLVFAGCLALCMPCLASNQFQEIRKFFEWGDYDSLFLKAIDLSQNDLPKSQKAELYKYLAVREYVKGNYPGAEESLSKSFSLDSASQLDPMFVSDSVMVFFSTVKEKWKQNLRTASQKDDNAAVSKSIDTLADSNEKLKIVDSAGSREIEPVRYIRKSHKAMLYLAGGGLVISGILGYFTYSEYCEGNENYRLLKEERDIDEFDKRKIAVEENNKWIIIYGSGTTVLSTASMYFLVRGLLGKKLKDDKFSSLGGVYSDFKFTGFNLGYRYRF